MKRYFRQLSRVFWRSTKARPRLQKAAIWYLRAVRMSCRFQITPKELLALAAAHRSYIIATWHGQNYLLPFALNMPNEIRVLVSGSIDGQFFAEVLTQLGFDVIVGSGAGLNPRDMLRKRGLAAFNKMLTTLRENCAVALTADVPKTPKVAGPGIIKLARHSGRPIVPVAVRTSHAFSLRNWDKTLVNLPFGRLTIIIGNPIFVEETDDAEVLEKRRSELEETLNNINDEAIRLCAYWRARKSWRKIKTSFSR
jgi:lysophospholipid acyltransferase (LPLAT)-like uncharacterized protein